MKFIKYNEFRYDFSLMKNDLIFYIKKKAKFNFREVIIDISRKFTSLIEFKKYLMNVNYYYRIKVEIRV